MLINLYASKRGFPKEPRRAFKRLYIKPRHRQIKTTISGLPLGNYAFAICHDLNANRRCDQNFIGIPTEPVGASNNAKGFLGPPSFQKAMFALNKPITQVQITLNK